MNILLVEDNYQKIEQICNLLDKNFFCLLKIDIAKNLEEANEKIDAQIYDIYILDLSLKSETHEASIEYGFEIYDRIKDSTKNIIIYSTVDNLEYHERKDQFVQDNISFINYSSRDITWETNFIIFMNKFIKNNKLHYDIAIITALDDEFYWMKKASKTNWYEMELDDNTYYVTKIKNNEGEEVSVIAYTANKMGMAYASAVSTKMLINFKPKLLVMTGICAGIENLEKGDIIIPEYIFNYQEGDITEEGFIPAFKTKQLDTKLSKLVRQTIDSYTIDIKDDWKKNYDAVGKMAGDKFRVINDKHFGTGSAVVKDEIILSEIKKYNQKDIVGLDMEGYSIFVACEVMEEIKCKPFLIKAVQDFANKEKDKTFRLFSCFASARYFFKLCEGRLITKLKNDW